MKKAAISFPHNAAGSTCVSRFLTATFEGSTPFLVKYSEMNHDPVEPTRVATVFPSRSCGFVISLSCNSHVAFCVPLDNRDGAVISLDAKEILHARKVAGHDDVALAGLERLECGGAGRKKTVSDVEAFLLIVTFLERHPDRVVVDGGLSEQCHLERRLLRLRRRRAQQNAGADCRREHLRELGHSGLPVHGHITETYDI